MATVLSDMKYWVFLMESQDCALQNSKSTGRALGTLSVQRLPFTETQRQRPTPHGGCISRVPRVIVRVFSSQLT